MEKKSLTNTLKNSKKPNLAAAPAKNQGASTRKRAIKKAMFLKLDE